MNQTSGLVGKSTIVATSLSVLSIICIIIFSVQYYFEKELNFSHENKLILFLAGGIFFLVCIFTIYFAVILKRILNRMNLQQGKIDNICEIVKTYKSNFESIDANMAGIEDNVVNTIRDTQSLIMKLEKEIGVVKCSEIKTPIEAGSGYSETP